MKRILSFILSINLIFILVPGTVLAALPGRLLSLLKQMAVFLWKRRRNGSFC